MDEEFLNKLKSISAKDVLTDQRPATSRLRSSRGSRGVITQAIPDVSKGNQIKRIEEVSEESSKSIQTIAELLSKPPPKAIEELNSKIESSNTVPKSARPLRSDGELGGFTRMRVTTAGGSRVPTAAGSRVPARSHMITTSIQDESTAEYIPDLNEIQAEEITQAVASAPEIEAERITSLRELDADLARFNTFSTVRGVDMRKLARFMLPENKLVLYSDQDEEMRSITYEQLYNDLLPLINGKNLITFDFATLKKQNVGDAFVAFEFAGTGSDGGFSQKHQKKKVDAQMMQKLEGYAAASIDKLSKKETPTKINMATLEETLKKAREKHERKHKAAK